MLSRRGAWAVAIVATLTMTVSYMDRATLTVLAPSVTKALGISEAAYGWLTASFSIAYLIATPLAGWWIDRVGARRGLVVSVLVWSTVAGLHALVPGLGLLLVMRVALGFTEGPSFPGASQTVQRVLPPEDRSRGFGVLFTGSSIGGMLVPLIATNLYEVAGWRVAFLGTAAVGLLWIPLWLAVTRSPAVRERIDARPEEVIGPRPSFSELVRHSIMRRALVAIFAAAPTIGFVSAFGAKYLERTFGVAQDNMDRYLWLPPLALDVGAVLFGDLAARQARAAGVPPKLLVAIAMVLAASPIALPYATDPWTAIALASVALAGGGALYTLVTADMMARMPRECVSFAGGIMAGAQSLALIVSSPLIGWSVDRYGTYDVAVVVLGCWVIPGTLLWIAWPPQATFEVRRSASRTES